jgi:hypothetical protein
MIHAGLLRIEGEAPDALVFLDRHGNPLVPPARAVDPVSAVLQAGGRPPGPGTGPGTGGNAQQFDIPDPITEAWIARHPRLDWSLSSGLRIRSGAEGLRSYAFEEVPDHVTVAWIDRQSRLQWMDGEGLRVHPSHRLDADCDEPALRVAAAQG